MNELNQTLYYCDSPTLAQRTVDYYSCRGHDWMDLNYKLADDKNHWIVYDSSTGKYLIPVTDPDLEKHNDEKNINHIK